jgi:hypothetical protein
VAAQSGIPADSMATPERSNFAGGMTKTLRIQIELTISGWPGAVAIHLRLRKIMGIRKSPARV